jgi:hypothetical protein
MVVAAEAVVSSDAIVVSDGSIVVSSAAAEKVQKTSNVKNFYKKGVKLVHNLIDNSTFTKYFVLSIVNFKLNV